MKTIGLALLTVAVHLAGAGLSISDQILDRGGKSSVSSDFEYDGALNHSTESKDPLGDGRKSPPQTSPPDFSRLLRWNHYGYHIDSSYPYLKQLPNWDEIPILLQWIASGKEDAGVSVAYSQLVALSRADFGEPGRSMPRLPIHAPDYAKRCCIRDWSVWWESVGKPYPERLKTKGRQNPDAWKLVTRDNVPPMPEYPVCIPDEWVLRTSYSAGDYGGIQTEEMTLRRKPGQASLIRALRQSTDGPLEWQQWEPLTTGEADDVAFAVAYAVDYPWLLKRYGAYEEAVFSKLDGRNLSTYYPSFSYHLADSTGNVWWNDDPWRWHGDEPKENNHFGPFACLGSVCRLLWRTFPDEASARKAALNSGGWKALRMPNAMLIEQAADDLELRGDVTACLPGQGRPSIALEILERFGRPENLAAIARLEEQLPRQLKEVESILAHDPNGELYRGEANAMIVRAVKARAAIVIRFQEQE